MSEKERRARTGREPRKYSTEVSPWQERARAAGLSQKTLAAMTGKTEISVSRQLRGQFGTNGEPPRYVAATIIAWELMSLEQRQEWLARLGSKDTIPPDDVIRPHGHERLCDAVKQRREELSLSREQVGNATGFSRFIVKDFEDGKDVSLSVAIRIAEAVGLTFDVVDTAKISGVIVADKPTEEETEIDIGDSLPDDLEQGR